MPPRSLDARAVLITLVLCGSWGFNQIAAKLAFADFGPLTQSSLRAIIGSLMLGTYAWRAKPGLFRSDGTWGPGLMAGLLFAFEFVLVFIAIKLTTAGSAAVFLFTAPLFVTLGAAVFLPAERPRPRQWLGMALAFVGVAIGLYSPGVGATLIGDLIALFGGVVWAMTTIVIKATKLRSADATKTLLYQTVVAAVVTPFAAWAAGEPWPESVHWISAAGIAYQSIWVIGISYLAWFWMLRVYRAAELSAFTFISPVVGVIAGWAVLGEKPSIGFAFAAVLVAVGIAIVNWPTRLTTPNKAGETLRD